MAAGVLSVNQKVVRRPTGIKEFHNAHIKAQDINILTATQELRDSAPPEQCQPP